MADVDIKDLHKIFDRTEAVRGIDLNIKDNEFVILVGPSGCGKSTVLRMIAGLEEVTKGEIYIGENLVNDVPPKDRDIAMVFQSYALYPHMTVFENMSFGLRLRKFSKEDISNISSNLNFEPNFDHLESKSFCSVISFFESCLLSKSRTEFSRESTNLFNWCRRS